MKASRLYYQVLRTCLAMLIEEKFNVKMTVILRISHISQPNNYVMSS